MANRAREEGKWRSFVYLGVEFGKGPRFKEVKKRVLSKIEGRVRKVEMLRVTFGLGTKEALSWTSGDGIWSGVGHRWMEGG